MTANMYRVGDYVYFETSSASPFQIRRIEELNKTPSGNVEAKVMCFYRRRDLPNPLVQLADKHQMATSEDSPVAMKLKRMWLKTPVGEEQAAQAVLDPAIAALDDDRNSPSSGGGGTGPGSGTGGGGGTAGGVAAATAAAALAAANVGGSGGGGGNTGGGTNNEKGESLTNKQRHQMKHRELFLSRQVETLPATHIRGKCSVTLLNETESLLSYLNKDDTFFYCLVFDPTQKTLLADKGEIRVGSRYQTDVTPLLKDGEQYDRCLNDLETLVWTPNHNLTDRKIDQFLVVSRSVGTFARALDCSSSVKQPSLHMSAAAASRDITLFHAMDTLHKHVYSVESAMCSLVPSSGPVLCRDEMEEWSASEANLFEEALDKFGKDFSDIRQDFLPWKTLKNIVEYYYMWKTTDRYVQQKRVKAVEAESKLKQVYIPNYTKSNPAVINNSSGGGIGNNNSSKCGVVGGSGNIGMNMGMNMGGGGGGVLNGNSNGNIGNNDVMALNIGKPCESCFSNNSTQQWYAWGPSHMNCRLCHTCWTYWKKYGGLKVASRLADNELDPLKKRVNDTDDEKTNIGTDGGGIGLGGVGVGGGGIGGGGIGVSVSVSVGGGGGVGVGVGGLGTGIALNAGGVIGGGGIGGATVVSRPTQNSSLSPSPLRCTIGNCLKEFKLKAHLGRHYAQAHGIVIRSGSPRPIMKTRTAFYLHTTPATRLSRRLCRHLIRPRRAARQPSFIINIQHVKLEFATAMNGKTVTDIKQLQIYKKKDRGSVTHIANRLGNPAPINEWLILTPKENMPKPDKVAFPKPPKAPDGSLMYERIPNKPEADKIPLNSASPSLKRRAYDEVNGIDSPVAVPPPTKRPNKDPAPNHRPTPEQYAAMMAAAAAAGQPLPRHHLNGKPKIAQMTRTGSGRKQVISWMDAPDDVYFRATETSKRTRRTITLSELRRAARKPWRHLHNRSSNLTNNPANAIAVAAAAAASAAAQAAAAAAAAQAAAHANEMQVVILD